MTNEYPSTRVAQQSEMAPWDQERYNVQRVTGKVSLVDMGSEVTQNGKTIEFYQIHISQPRDIVSITPVEGEVVLRQDPPRALQFRQAQQGYFWLCESAGVDNLGELVGKERTFAYSFRPYTTKEGYDRREHYYLVEGATTAIMNPNGAALAPAEPTEDALQAAFAELDGKTQQQFNLAALKIPAITDDTVLKRLITSGSFIKQEVAAGNVIENADGTFSVLSLIPTQEASLTT